MEDVRRRLAASDLEIDTALRSAMAVEIDGKIIERYLLTSSGFVYRMTPAYVTQILDFIITAATADSLPLDALTLVSILTSFADEERPECIQTILRTFSKSPIERILSLARANLSLHPGSVENNSMVRRTYPRRYQPQNANCSLHGTLAICHSCGNRQGNAVDHPSQGELLSSYANYDSLPSCIRIINYS